MANAGSKSHVFVGAARTRSELLGGLFRLAPGSDAFERISKGLPDESISVQAIAIHPSQPEIVFIGTRSGAFRSADHGASWQRLDIPGPGLEFWSICLHPGNPATVFAGSSPVGIFRSDDSGATWRKLNTPVLPQRVHGQFSNRVMRIAVDARDPLHMYATLEINGTLRSLDGGENWEDCSASLIRLADDPTLKSRIEDENDAEGMLDGHAVCCSPAAAGSAFLAVRMGLFRSDDSGLNWRSLEIGRHSPHRYGRDLRVSPQDPRVLYACLAPASVSAEGSIFRSADLGQTWQRFDRASRPRSTMMGVALHHDDPDQVYGVTRRGQVFGTIDGGRSWSEHRLPEACQDVFSIACG